jgi:hypothetical protein
MSNPEIALTIIRAESADVSPEQEESLRLRMARLKTQNFLTTWRSRFISDDVTATYDMPAGEKVTIRSSQAGQADLAVHYTDGSRASYMLDAGDASSPEPILEQHIFSPTGQRVPPIGDEAAWHDSLSQFLFDCDTIQTNG